MAGQLAAIADARRSPEPERDYGVAEAHLGDAPFPDAVDLRRAWHPIADQGRTASCVGWTVADSLVRWHLVEAGRLAPDVPLSARYVWMAAKEWFQRETFPSTFLETDGTSLKAGLDVVRKFGVALEEELPWDGFVTKDYESFNRDVRRRRIMAYYNLGLDAHEWRHWMHASGPVAVLIKEDRAAADHERRPRRLRRGLGQRQPRRRAVRLRPRPLPAALELGHRLGRCRATRA